ncbi:MAG: hypothetical protein O7G85_08685 [Planctomycetota bacterium]|nr:hypothetical protein [Planctomycetota bacterium]
MTGVCTECGLPFEWGELLCNRRVVPRWCVEYARGWRLWPTAIKTLLVLYFRPRKFWRELKMVHEPRWGRLGMILLAMAMMLYIVFALSVGRDMYRYVMSEPSKQVSSLGSPELVGAMAALLPFSDHHVYFKYSDSTGSHSGFTLPPVTFARQRLWTRIWYDTRASIRSSRFLVPGLPVPVTVILAQSMLLILLCPLGFLALPRSLQKAKVRHSHLFRIWIYSFALLAAPFFILFVGRFVMQWPMLGFMSPVTRLAMLRYVMFSGSLLWLVLWWSLACKHFLKLPHAWGVGVSMVVLGYIMGLLVISLVDFMLI